MTDALNAPTVHPVPTSIITPSDDSDSDEREGTPILPNDAYTDDEDTDGVRAFVCEQQHSSSSQHSSSTAAARVPFAFWVLLLWTSHVTCYFILCSQMTRPPTLIISQRSQASHGRLSKAVSPAYFDTLFVLSLQQHTPFTHA